MSATSEHGESFMDKFTQPPRWPFVVCAGLAIAVFATGCTIESPKPWEKVYPVKGVLKFKDKPLSRAQITLIPQNSEFPDSVRPTATTKDDGTFEFGTYSKDDGAPAGAYKAIVLHYPVVGPKDNPSSGPNDLPAKYARAETTDLTVQVGEEETLLAPLQLR